MRESYLLDQSVLIDLTNAIGERKAEIEWNKAHQKIEAQKTSRSLRGNKNIATNLNE